jgi:hypothetical protein
VSCSELLKILQEQNQFAGIQQEKADHMILWSWNLECACNVTD